MLGAGEPSKAKRSMKVAVGFACKLIDSCTAVIIVCLVLWSSVVVAVMLSYHRIGQLFTNDRYMLP